MEDNLMGIMNQSDMDNYDIHDNTIYDNNGIENNHLGIVVNDAYASLNVSNNEILVDHPADHLVGISVDHIPPFGIRITGTAQATAPTSVIDHNRIRILTPAGYGIENSNGNTGQYITNNYITFNSTASAGPTGYLPKEIHGINNLNSIGTYIMHNRVDGIDPFLYQTAFENTTNSTGIFMFNTDANVLRCNWVYYTAYGIYADDYNLANLVNANFMFDCIYPWYFDGGVGSGDATFGSLCIGSPLVADMENHWLCLENAISGICCQGVCNPNMYKIFRDNPTDPGDVICTNPSLIVGWESSSNAGAGFEYLISPLSSTLTDPCETDEDFNNMMLVNGITESQNMYFKQVAETSFTSINAPDFGEWYKRMKLMSQLDINIPLRNSDSVFTMFYDQNENGTLGQLITAVKAIRLFKAPAPDIATFEQRYVDAVADNDQINSTLGFEQNEKEMNALVIKAHHIGLKNLSAQDKETIMFYAHSCPYINGTSVFIARTLWAFFRPDEQYSNDSLCQNANKGSLSQQPAVPYSENQLNIYPNPANTQLTINYVCKEDGFFELYNIVGTLIFRTSLPKGEKIKLIDLPSCIMSGSYYFKGNFKDSAKGMLGKLTIIR